MQKGAARDRPRALFPRITFAYLVAQGFSTHIGLDHARLDLQKAHPEGRHQRGDASTLAVDQRRQQERIDLRLVGHLADLVGDTRKHAHASHAFAQSGKRRAEARTVERCGRGFRLGRPALRILQLVHPRTQQPFFGMPLARRPRRPRIRGQYIR